MNNVGRRCKFMVSTPDQYRSGKRRKMQRKEKTTTHTSPQRKTIQRTIQPHKNHAQTHLGEPRATGRPLGPFQHGVLHSPKLGFDLLFVAVCQLFGRCHRACARMVAVRILVAAVRGAPVAAPVLVRRRPGHRSSRLVDACIRAARAPGCGIGHCVRRLCRRLV